MKNTGKRSGCNVDPLRMVLSFAILVLALAACQVFPPPPHGETPLPAPEVRSTPLGILATPAINIISPTPETTPIGEDLAGFAQQAYGKRLIVTLRIPSLTIDAPVVPVGWMPDPADPQTLEWDSPEGAVGWAISSHLPGEDGNIILYGHNNIHTAVFKYLYQLKEGDEIHLQTGEKDWLYRVNTVEIIPITGDEKDLVTAAEYLKDSLAPKLTLLSCYPPDNNTHRVIVVAYPENH